MGHIRAVIGYSMEYTMEQQWGIPWSSNRVYHGAAIGHTMEQQRGYYRVYHRAAIGHTMEQQWGIPWSSNGAYHGATMGHTMEQ